MGRGERKNLVWFRYSVGSIIRGLARRESSSMVNANAGRFGVVGAAFAACVLAGAAGTCAAQQHEVVVNNLTGSFSQHKNFNRES